MEIHFSGKCDATLTKTLQLFEIARVLVRSLDRVAYSIVNANHCICDRP